MSSQPPRSRARQFFANLGPGLITGAADDDPSGISTYAVSGASFGYAPLWTALFSFPLMAAVQLMCARLGMITGRGLAGVVRRRYPRWVLWAACTILVVANTVNIAADLAGMGETMEMVTHVSSLLWTPFFALLIVSFLFWSSYAKIARIFKWLTLALFAYVIDAFLIRPGWWEVLRSTLSPHVEWSGEYMSMLTGILGTTISPYLFFWQAAQEVEEERAIGRNTVVKRRGATPAELARSRVDIMTGMFFSNFVMYFIILTTAATLHTHGRTNITTARQAAEALRPLAGQAAYWLFTLGVIGAGMLGVPVLAGSSAYALGEAAGWRSSLNEKVLAARKFYAVVGVSMLIGMALDAFHFNAVALLFWAAVLNGILAPPLVALVVLLTADKKVMGEHTTGPLLRTLGWITVVAMSVCAAAVIGLLLV